MTKEEKSEVGTAETQWGDYPDDGVAISTEEETSKISFKMFLDPKREGFEVVYGVDNNFEGFVELTLPGTDYKRRMSLYEARVLAVTMSRCCNSLRVHANAAQDDVMMALYLRDQLEIKDRQMTAILKNFRLWQNTPVTESEKWPKNPDLDLSTNHKRRKKLAHATSSNP